MPDFLSLKRTPVESSNIKAIAYDEKEVTLVVEFHNGHVYCYSPVNKETYDALKDAESKGKYLHANIIHNKKLVYQKLL
jgi:hypothetical protein